uniref:Uncharacterized protein n=1 Tax=Branchiostoma floridae TaxID=7739 RepID=C3YQL0_BRAFL|eukprot:XP_002601354.1 hypothetical protein BRAFLDRAFT_82722 [Branchiostoma floridae]
MTEWAKTYGPVYRIQLGKETMVVLSGYDVMHEAFLKRGEDFSSRPFNPIVAIINPERLGILGAPFGTPWKEHRKFTLMSLREFGFGKRSLEGKIMEESVALQAEIVKMGNKPFDINRMVQNAVTNVQEEIHSVLGHDKPPSTAHRAQMPYTEAVLTEVARIGTILPTSIFHATSRDTSLHGYDIPEGTTVMPNLWSVHHDPEHFPNPGKFDPGRFLDAQGQYQRDDHVMPFGIGPRMCLGKQLAEMELFVFFTSLLQHFTFKLPEGAAKPSTTGINGITHSPKNFKLVAEPLA